MSPDNVNLLLSDDEVPMATPEQLSLVHEKDYVRFLQGMCLRYDAGPDVNLPSDPEVLRFSPLVVSRLFPEQEQRAYFGASKHVTSATRFSPGSYRAALRSAGAVVRAVEIVLGDEFEAQRAFCIVRPPGHHAGPLGYSPEAGGCGFCLVNNVMVGAAEAMRLYPGLRVAVVDIDVHHGNGSQDIVDRKLAFMPLLYCSIHLREAFPGEPDMDFFPGSGAERDDEQVLNVPVTPLWTVPAAAPAKAAKGGGKRAGAGAGREQPRSKRARAGELPDNPPEPVGASPRDQREQPSLGQASPGAACNRGGAPSATLRAGRAGWRDGVEHRIIPKLQLFKPDLIIMSSGFDACFLDEGCMQDGQSGLDLTEEDFRWATELIVNKGGAERIVSVLEGGYGRWTGEGYDHAPFADCVMAHVAALLENRP